MKQQKEFNVNQKVWRIHQIKLAKKMKCPTCEGYGVLYSKNKKPHECFRCKGNKEITSEDLKIRYVIDRVRIIERIHYESTFYKSYYHYYVSKNLKKSQNDSRSSFIVQVERLFKTKKEAEAALEKLKDRKETR